MAESNTNSEMSVAANFETGEVVTGSLQILVLRMLGQRVVAGRKAVLVREFSEGGSEVSRRGGRVLVELFDEILAEAKVITTGGTGEHGETRGKA